MGTKQKKQQPSVSTRILRTGPAIIDDITERYGPSVDVNLCQGVPRIGISDKVQEKLAMVLRDSQIMMEISKYGDLVGLPDLLKLWGNVLAGGYNNKPELDLDDLDELKTIFLSHELMITAGANQGFVNVILTICDQNDEVILVLPYYLSHVNALVMTGVVPIPVPVDHKTFIPRIEDIKARLTERSKAIVIVNPGNPSGIVTPKYLIEQVSSLCKDHGIWLVIDEAYREFLYDDKPGFFSPEPDGHTIKLYTMSKVYGMAGWRVGAILYPELISTEMKKVQDTIPTHASLISQVAAYEALKENPLYGKESYVNKLRFVRSCFLQHLKDAYSMAPGTSFVIPNGAFYFFLPYDEVVYIPLKTEREARYAVEFLATKFHILVLPGFSFGMCGYIRASYGKIDAKEAKKVSFLFGTAFHALLKDQKRRRRESASMKPSKNQQNN
ncbi:Aminotransferase [Gracilaria domingensis]|nr:Aminotransferase [Gracilaria domingensis]